MIKAVIPGVTTTGRHAICRWIIFLHNKLCSNMTDFLTMRCGEVSLNADSWLSSVYKGLVFTGYWIDKHWRLYSANLDFKMVPAPHTRVATCVLLKKVIVSWDLAYWLRVVTTDNTSEMISAVRKLTNELNVLSPESHYGNESLHVCCIVKVINLEVRERMKVVHVKIRKIRTLFSSTRASVKRRDLFEQCKKELKIKWKLPNLDAETRWSSTSTMVKQAFHAQRVLCAVFSWVDELSDLAVSEVDWKVIKKNCNIFEGCCVSDRASERPKLCDAQHEFCFVYEFEKSAIESSLRVILCCRWWQWGCSPILRNIQNIFSSQSLHWHKF